MTTARQNSLRPLTYLALLSEIPLWAYILILPSLLPILAVLACPVELGGLLN